MNDSAYCLHHAVTHGSLHNNTNMEVEEAKHLDFCQKETQAEFEELLRACDRAFSYKARFTGPNGELKFEQNHGLVLEARIRKYLSKLLPGCECSKARLFTSGLEFLTKEKDVVFYKGEARVICEDLIAVDRANVRALMEVKTTLTSSTLKDASAQVCIPFTQNVVRCVIAYRCGWDPKKKKNESDEDFHQRFQQTRENNKKVNLKKNLNEMLVEYEERYLQRANQNPEDGGEEPVPPPDFVAVLEPLLLFELGFHPEHRNRRSYEILEGVEPHNFFEIFKVNVWNLTDEMVTATSFSLF